MNPIRFFTRALMAAALPLAGLFAFAGAAWAVADLNVQVSDQGQPLPGGTLTLTFPDGATQTYVDQDGDGAISVALDQPGRYFAAITPPAAAPTGETEYQYDSAGRVIGTTDPAENETRYVYDSAGRVVGTTEAEGGDEAATDTAETETGVQYDSAGRVIGTPDPGGSTTEYQYDAAGRVIRTTDPESAGGQASVEGVSGVINHAATEAAQPQMVALNVPEEGELTVQYDRTADPAPRVYLNGANVSLLEAMQPIEVGPKDDVGTKGAGEKIAGGVAKTVLGGLFGGGGGGKSPEPDTKRDPVRKTDPAVCTGQASGVEGEVRTGWADDGFLVSTEISEHDDKGTFQAIFLVDEYGNVLPPARFEVYKLWAKHTLTVSWTQSTYVDGQLVSQETGGWSESWLEDLGTFKRRTGARDFPPIWALMGYDRAHAGVRRLGAVFKITPEQLAAAGRVWIVAHVTMPKMDPVMTTPLVAEIVPGENGDYSIRPWMPMN